MSLADLNEEINDRVALFQGIVGIWGSKMRSNEGRKGQPASKAERF